MLALYFKDFISALTIVLVLGMILFIVYALKQGGKITKWNRLIALFVLVGTAISALSATRDAFMAPGALFTLSSVQVLVCSVAGGAIFLAAIVSIFFKNQAVKRGLFYGMSALLVLQVAVIESSRIINVL